MELLEPPILVMPSENRFEVRLFLKELQPLSDDAIRHELLQLANLTERYAEVKARGFKDLTSIGDLPRGIVPTWRGQYGWTYLMEGLKYPWLDWIQMARYRLCYRDRYSRYHYRELPGHMRPYMGGLRKDLRQIYRTRK